MLKTKRMSLKLKTALCMLLAMVVGAGVGVGFYFVGNECVDKFYMTQELADKREQKFVDNFHEYVEENNVKSTDTGKIHEWCKKKQYIYLQLFKGKTISLVVNVFTTVSLCAVNHANVPPIATPTTRSTAANNAIVLFFILHSFLFLLLKF